MIAHRSLHPPRAIELVSKGLVDVRSLVTQRFPLEDPHDYFGHSANNVMKRLKNIKLENRSND